MKTNYLIFLLLSLFILACENITIEESNDPVVKFGTLVWKVEYELDGCGFTVEIDDEIYKPENENIIDENYKSIIELQ